MPRNQLTSSHATSKLPLVTDDIINLKCEPTSLNCIHMACFAERNGVGHFFRRSLYPDRLVATQRKRLCNLVEVHLAKVFRIHRQSEFLQLNRIALALAPSKSQACHYRG